MSLQTVKNQKGFTIVELLIVIVVIGILAAITIVAYNGIQKRANATSAQSNAASALKKIEAYNSVKGSYAATATQLNSVDESKFTGTGISIAAVSSTNGKTAVEIEACDVTGTSPNQVAAGSRVRYWDFTSGSSGAASAWMTAGTTSGTCVALGA